MYFWICNVFLDLSWYFYNRIVLLRVELSPKQTKWGSIDCLPRGIQSGFG